MIPVARVSTHQFGHDIGHGDVVPEGRDRLPARETAAIDKLEFKSGGQVESEKDCGFEPYGLLNSIPFLTRAAVCLMGRLTGDRGAASPSLHCFSG